MTNAVHVLTDVNCNAEMRLPNSDIWRTQGSLPQCRHNLL